MPLRLLAAASLLLTARFFIFSFQGPEGTLNGMECNDDYEMLFIDYPV